DPPKLDPVTTTPTNTTGTTTATTVPTTTVTPTPAPVQVPTDTPSLVKYALEEVNRTIDRVDKEMSESDPVKESRMKRLIAFKSTLSDYVQKNTADNDAKGYAESALSQIKSMTTQLDLVKPTPTPTPTPTNGKKK